MTGKKNPFYGKTHSEKAKKKIRLSRLGKKTSEETLVKMRGRIPWNKGKKPEGVCEKKNCSRTICVKKLCRYHYDQSTEERRGKESTRPKCSKSGCNIGATRGGFCRNHYLNSRHKIYDNDTSRPKCLVDGCKKSGYLKNYCKGHYDALRLHKLREKLFEILGGKKCVKCGFDDQRALQFDHIHDDGSIERKKRKTTALSYYYYTDNPSTAKKRIQVLCANCNRIKGYSTHFLYASNWFKKLSIS